MDFDVLLWQFVQKNQKRIEGLWKNAYLCKQEDLLK